MEKQFRWTKEKEEELKELWSTYSVYKLARKFHTTSEVIKQKIEELNLPEHKRSKWTKEEEQLLVELSSKCHILEICKALNRTENSVLSKANKMGLEYITLERKYTEEELNYIKDNWGIIPATEMAIQLKVAVNMIYRQADIMNLPKLGNSLYKKWTEKEVEKLKKYSKTETITELAKRFKTTNNAIITVAYRYKIKLINEKVHWSEEDNNKLREYAKTMNLQEIASKMNISSSAVRLHAKRLGITVKKHDMIWTEENDEQLKQLVKENKSLFEIVKIMNKTDFTIIKKARLLGLEIELDDKKEWTEEDIKRLIELSKTKKLNELVNELERSSYSIIFKAKKLGIEIKSNRKNWTKEEEAKLKQLVTVDKKTVKEIAEILDRTEEGIIVRINRLGLKIQTNAKKYWTKEEEDLLTELWGNKSIEYISKKLNRTASSIRNKVFLLGLGSAMNNNYDSLRLSDISKIFNISIHIVRNYWIPLGLKVKSHKVTQTSSYRCVKIKDLFDFLEHHQDIWDSRNLERNILGEEPVWLQEKRKRDRDIPPNKLRIENMTKQQLIDAKKYYLEQAESMDESTVEDPGFRKKFTT